MNKILVHFRGSQTVPFLNRIAGFTTDLDPDKLEMICKTIFQRRLPNLQACVVVAGKPEIALTQRNYKEVIKQYRNAPQAVPETKVAAQIPVTPVIEPKVVPEPVTPVPEVVLDPEVTEAISEIESTDNYEEPSEDVPADTDTSTSEVPEEPDTQNQPQNNQNNRQQYNKYNKHNRRS